MRYKRPEADPVEPLRYQCFLAVVMTNPAVRKYLPGTRRTVLLCAGRIDLAVGASVCRVPGSGNWVSRP